MDRNICPPGVRFVEILTESGSFPIQEIEVSSSSSPANRNTMAGVSSAPSGQEGLYLLISRYHETNAGKKGKLDLVLERNLRNAHLEEVHILSETNGTLFLPARVMETPPANLCGLLSLCQQSPSGKACCLEQCRYCLHPFAWKTWRPPAVVRAAGVDPLQVGSGLP